jgi:hypothetical protein
MSKQVGLTIVVAAALSVGFAGSGYAKKIQRTAGPSPITSAILDGSGSSIGAVTIVGNATKNTLTYSFNLTNPALSLTNVFMDAGGTARNDLGSLSTSLGTFTDHFAARGTSFSVTFKGTDVPGSIGTVFGGVTTNHGVFFDAVSAVPGPIAGAGLPGLIFAGGGLLAWWRRKRTAQAV